MRKLAEEFYGAEVVHGACQKNYIRMKLDNARMPSLPNFIFDESPEKLKPTAVSGFITEDYDLFVGGHIDHRTKKD